MLIAISLSVGDNQQKRVQDILEHNYVRYFEKFGATILLIPNSTDSIATYFSQFPINAIILSGGGNISISPSTAQKPEKPVHPKREALERKLIEIAAERNIPILGICRGMQLINIHFGGRLVPSRHPIGEHQIEIIARKEELGEKARVNSFHDWAVIKETQAVELKPFAFAEDGGIEGLYHPHLPIGGVQWHPERMSFDDALNKILVTALLKRELFWGHENRL
ncbi:gamma-glutamyl-gamma-aminobutyrate hydrolase family protein [Candidatus Woesearchaeota archaeon]|nr:gamma-glutamyl-gamma-aminobutyrate hydrolase family protein [Candidatus Woesearchaeota archaeon]